MMTTEEWNDMTAGEPRTMTHPLAALIAGVPRYDASAVMWTLENVEPKPTPKGKWVSYDDVLAALEAAPVPDLVEAGKVVERLRAEKSVIGTTRTFPSGDERDMVLVPHYGPNPLAHKAADTIRALIALATAQAAQIAGVEKDRDTWKIDAKRNHKAADDEHDRAEAAEAKVAELEAAIDSQDAKEAGLWRFWSHKASQLATKNAQLMQSGAAAEAEAATLRAEVERLRGAGIALRDDMLERSRAGIDAIHGEEYRIVNAGRTAWDDFCAALEEEGRG